MLVTSMLPVNGDPDPPRAAAKLSPTPSDATFIPGPAKLVCERMLLPTMFADAARMRIRLFDGVIAAPPSRVVIVLPVPWSCVSTSDTVAVGLVCIMIAPAPATCGVAIDVPLNTAKPFPGTDELINDPGASSSTWPEWSEKDDSRSDFVVEPTVMA